MPVLLHRSHQLEKLADLLAAVLRDSPPPDPITPHTVVVGSQGMERWLRAHLAQAHGICANVEFIFPARAIDRLVEPFVGARPEPDPWSPEALTWTVLRLLPELLDRDVMAPVRAWLADDHEPVSRRRYGLARELADVLDRYHLARPDLIASFADSSPPTDPTQAWQAELWRACRNTLAAPCPTEQTRTAMQALAGGARVELPALHLFGISALPPLWLHLLHAASTTLPIHLLLFSPSEQWWADFLTQPEANRLGRRGPLARVLADSALADQHPLLTSLGRLSRDMQALLAEHLPSALEPAEALLRDDDPPHSALTHLQRDLRELALPDPPHLLDPKDRSVRIHACAGAARQAHALRDSLLDLFARDTSLSPRDVVVLTPDIDTFGPLIQGALEQGGDRPDDPAWAEAGGPRLPCTVSDRRLRSDNPCADALLRLLELADGRMRAPAVFALASLEPVARRFAFSADDLSTLRHWIEGSGFRWGLDSADRARHDQPADLQNTLRFALRRLALGVLQADEGALLPAGSDPPVSPFDDLEGHDVALFGRFAELLDTLEHHAVALRGARPLPEHVRALRQALVALVEPDPERRAPFEEVHQTLDTLDLAAQVFERPVRLAAVRHLLTGHFEHARHADRPITGAITVSALTPMRSVPFRVVCLVGIDDGAFPRTSSRPTWDLIAVHPKPGDRDPRDEDRHLLLESIFAAQEHLIVTCTARDAQRGTAVPFALPIAELLDTLDTSFQTASGAPARTQLLHSHPLQPTAPSAYDEPEPSFDARSARLAHALTARRRPLRAFPRRARLPIDPSTPVDLAELGATLAHPQRALCRRLRLRPTTDEPTPHDREPLSVGGLSRWKVLSDALDRCARDGIMPLERFYRTCRARGQLQPGAAGLRQAEVLHHELVQLHSARQDFSEPSRAVQIDLELPPAAGTELGRRVVGELPALGPDGPVHLSPSDPGRPATLVKAWVELLALAASDSGRHAFSLGLKGSKASGMRLSAPPDPMAVLQDLVALYDLVCAQPAPLLPKTSHALITALLRTDPELSPQSIFDHAPRALPLALALWGTPHKPGADRSDHAVRLLLGDEPPFLLDHGGLDPALLTLAARLWVPILQHLDKVPLREVAA